MERERTLFSNNRKVSIRQMKRLLFLELFGISSLILPGLRARFCQTDGIFAIALGAAAAGGLIKWLLDQAECIVTLWNGQPISVTPPNFVELEIVDTDPGLKGDTAGTGGKPATLSTGAVVKVPLFVQIGEVIKVDTRSGEYVSRVK